MKITTSIIATLLAISLTAQKHNIYFDGENIHWQKIFTTDLEFPEIQKRLAFGEFNGLSNMETYSVADIKLKSPAVNEKGFPYYMNKGIPIAKLIIEKENNNTYTATIKNINVEFGGTTKPLEIYVVSKLQMNKKFWKAREYYDESFSVLIDPLFTGSKKATTPVE